MVRKPSLKRVMQGLVDKNIEVIVDHGTKEPDIGFFISNPNPSNAGIIRDEFLLNIPCKTIHWVWIDTKKVKSISNAKTGEVLF